MSYKLVKPWLLLHYRNVPWWSIVLPSGLWFLGDNNWPPLVFPVTPQKPWFNIHVYVILDFSVCHSCMCRDIGSQKEKLVSIMWPSKFWRIHLLKPVKNSCRYCMYYTPCTSTCTTHNYQRIASENLYKSNLVKVAILKLLLQAILTQNQSWWTTLTLNLYE